MTPSRLRGRAVVIVGVRTRLPRPKMCQGERLQLRKPSLPSLPIDFI